MTTRRRKSERPPSDSLTDWFLVYPKARLDTSPKGSSITTAHEGREWPRRDDPNQRQPDPEADIPHIPTYSNQARPQYYPVTSIFGLTIHPSKMNEGLCDNTLRRLVCTPNCNNQIQISEPPEPNTKRINFTTTR